jgi:hypothetical protein
MFHPVELLHEWETRANRPLSRPQGLERAAELWSHADGTTLNASMIPRTSPELMIVLMTYARARSSARLLQQLGAALQRSGLGSRASLLVLRDACAGDYSAARAAARTIEPNHVWLDARRRFGKAGFWRMHQTALDVARLWQPERALYLQDDVEFEPDLLLRADRIWRATAADPKRRVLYLFSSSDDEPNGRWVRHRRRDLPGVPCRWTNWFDLQAFLVDRQFFELLDYRMVPVHPNRWKRRPMQSSGVGRQWSRRLFGRAHVYQAWPPLVLHGAEPSSMNPEARQQRALDNRNDFHGSLPRARPESANHPLTL